MPLRVTCPECSKELNAPDELAGKMVACPRCQKQFPVKGGVQVANQANVFPPGFEPASASAPTPPPPPAAAQPAGSTPAGAAKFILPAADPPQTPPASGQKASNPPPVPPTPPRTTAPPSPPQQPRTTPTPADPPAESTTVRRRRDMERGSGKRSLQQATFITAAPVETNVPLGADGKLPDLHLTEEKQKDDTAEEKPRSPLLVIAALTISVGMSVLMLVFDFESTAAPVRSKEVYRQDLVEHYTQPTDGGELKPYQKNLRAALQAHNRGDSRIEKIYLRRVLDMMEAEDVSPTRGITGKAQGEYPASDEHLRSTISQLLREE